MNMMIYILIGYFVIFLKTFSMLMRSILNGIIKYFMSTTIALLVVIMMSSQIVFKIVLVKLKQIEVKKL